MKKWYVDEVFVRNGKVYDRGYYIVQDGDQCWIEWSDPIPGGETFEFEISECYHVLGEPNNWEKGAQISVEDGELLGELVEVSVERLEILDDTPNRDEAYAILTDGERYAFAWGPEYPYADVVPAQDVRKGESGIEWFETEDDARAAMNQAVQAWESARGN